MTQLMGFAPIGFVVSDLQHDSDLEDTGLKTSAIEIKPEFEPGLMGLAPGQDIYIIYRFSHTDDYELQLHPRHDPTIPTRGVFATRSQYRPNGIGLTLVRVLSIAGNVLIVDGLDAFNGTIVLDIKPYSVNFDAPADGGGNSR